MKQLIALSALLVAECASPSIGPPISSVDQIYWSDGDSGRLNGMKFRLANVDAPETGGVGARGGAKCEAERELGYRAKEFVVEFTRGKSVTISHTYGQDNFERTVVDLMVDGRQLSDAAIAAGHLKPWPHKGRKALAKKPNWCKFGG